MNRHDCTTPPIESNSTVACQPPKEMLCAPGFIYSSDRKREGGHYIRTMDTIKVYISSITSLNQDSILSNMSSIFTLEFSSVTAQIPMLIDGPGAVCTRPISSKIIVLEQS